MKLLAKLICCFIPIKSWRKTIRQHMYERKEKLRKHIKTLGKIGDFQIHDIDGVSVATGMGLNLGYVFDGDAMVVVQEVFGNDEYHFDIGSDAIVIDIGMNIGLASLYFASRDDVKHVYGFEPFKPTFDQAAFNFSINEKIVGKIQAFNYGLGDKDKDLVFEYYAQAPGQMSTVKNVVDTHPWRKGKLTSESVKIKDAAPAIQKIIDRHKDMKIVLKCDTEGSEKEIFERLDDAGILRSVDAIMLEYHFSYDKPVIDILRKNRFNLFKQKIITLDTGDFGMIRAIKSS